MTIAPALFEVTEQRHPMWTYRPDPMAAPWCEAVLKELARNLVRFDGRDDLGAVIGFCEGVHRVVTQCDGAAETLIGSVVMYRVRFAAKLTGRAARQTAIMTGLCERLVQAAVKVTS